MLTYIELIELREKLSYNEIEVDAAKDLYWSDFKEGKQSWHTKDRKKRRAKVIKDKCQICDSTKTLTIQHLSHPKKYADYKLELTRAFTNGHRENNPNVARSEFIDYIVRNYEYIPTPLCPNCKWSNPSVRVRKKPKYLCLG